MAEAVQGRLAKIKVFGIGGAGNNVVNRMMEAGVTGVEFVAVNTDQQELSKSICKKKIQIGEELAGGRGAGSKPEVGMRCALESGEVLLDAMEGADLIFLTAGLGGGTGTGAIPILAELAKRAGIPTVAVVTKPFKFEGANRMRQAEAGIAALSGRVDSLLIIPNDQLKNVTDRKITLTNAFAIADDVMKQAVTSISELVLFSEQVTVGLDHEGIAAIMKNFGWVHADAGAAPREERSAEPEPVA